MKAFGCSILEICAASSATSFAPLMAFAMASPAAGEAIAKAIKGAKLVALDAAHISNVEQPKAFTDAVLNFLLN